MRIAFGVWADRHGGRRLFLGVMIIAAVATWFVADATTFPMILAAGLGTGLAGSCSAVGLSYITRWYPQERHGTALGILGAGNAGSAITKLGAPWVMLAYGWQGVARLWALLLLCTAAVFWLGSAEDPKQTPPCRGRSGGTAGESNRAAPASAGLAFRPLLFLRFWRLCRAHGVAAALPDRGLRPRHPGGKRLSQSPFRCLRACFAFWEGSFPTATALVR
jgi:NNP family nitrate/nitrite transporter-like MFS transporter